MTEFRPHRSALYLPAANARAVEKARTLEADVVILDLEDAVAPDAKPAARSAAVEAVKSGGWGRRAVAIRVNGIGTNWYESDFLAVQSAKPAAVVVPKVNSAAEAAEAVRLAGGVPVWAMIETPRGVQAADSIADTPGVAALVVGAADLEKDLGCRVGPARAEIGYALQRVIIAARAAGILAFDAMYADIKDMEGLEAVTLQGRALGFDGKTLIHPAQIETVNRVFSPSAAEVEQAHRIVAAFEAATADGKGVATLDGKIVEVLHAAQARELITFAESIASH